MTDLTYRQNYPQNSENYLETVKLSADSLLNVITIFSTSLRSRLARWILRR